MTLREGVGANRTATASGLASVALALLLATENDGIGAFAAWLASLSFGVAATRGRHGVAPIERADRVLLTLATILGLLFRVWRVVEIPNGLWIDELATAANAARLKEGPFRPFGTTALFADGPEWVHTTNLYLYACLTVLQPLGFSQGAIKLLSVLPGVAAVPALFLFARRVVPRVGAFAAAALLAVSPWHVTVSRWGWDQVLVTTLAIAAFAFLHDGMERDSSRASYVAGIVVGAAQFAYLAARLLALGAAFALAVRLLARRERPPRSAALLFAAGLLQASLPLVVLSLQEPSRLHVRAQEISIVPALRHGDLAPLAENLRAYAPMLHVAGDRNPRQNLPGEPMLSPVTGLLFLAGLFVALTRPTQPASLIALTWLGTGLLGGVLSGPQSAPNSYRVGLVEPACMILAGIAVAWMCGPPWRSREGTLARLAWPVTATAVVLSTVLTFISYFASRPASRECWQGLEDGAQTEILRRAVEAGLESGNDVALDARLRTPTAVLMFGDVLPVRWPDRRVAFVDRVPSPRRSLVFVTTPATWDALPQEWASLPAVAVSDPYLGPFAVAVTADPGLAARIRAVTGS
ncbi:MAG: glycosyltransferase family 39 protein [Acidobacteriota bacterium]